VEYREIHQEFNHRDVLEVRDFATLTALIKKLY